ncbi:hypothetical protein GCM10007276_29420 [Agaricicola taiwanensis]|uniref:Filamentous haemagglutinin FhaB/tRNA nuclease CdiA-like TPS domain-containing protein n=1 Tax=Agaricicola taiwanensis TaxID=591372 RepID=A0A8J2YL97_9RHOB|nr:MBG domain-containing protein [Agaricicola taiwanensis]GGE50450.1 hypothetical protein GCM10007276_29420 [Agaricicola taiwanensis]
MTSTAVAALAAAGVGRPQAQELPTGGQVTSGQAVIGAPSAGGLTVTQSSNTAIIGWDSFSVGSGGRVHFDNGSGATLNRVWGNVPSSLDGSLTATGSLYLVNPAGITVGTNGMVGTGGSFIASTHDVDDAAFHAQGDMTFKGTSEASVINHGRISALGGDVALIARRVENTGEIDAPEGTAALAAGYEVLMRDRALADGKFVVKVGGSGTEAKTTGVIRAAEAELKANGGNVYALAGNTKSIVKATGVQNRGGRIFLTAGAGGKVQVTQKLVAKKVKPRVQTAAPLPQERPESLAGGEIRISGDEVRLSSTIDVRGEGAEGGLVIAEGRTITVDEFATIDASGTMGGTILIGGDFQGGKDPTKNYADDAIATAETTTVKKGAQLIADGSQGEGGRIVVWSDEVTSFEGAISATGGGSGRGGDAEVSGKRLLHYAGEVDLTAISGTFGTLLLDPYNVTISAGAGTTGGGFSANGNDSVINVTDLQNALASANVVVTTGGSGTGSQNGDITVQTAVTWSSAATLTLDAYRNIAVNANITGGAGSKVVLRADNAGTGTGTVSFAGGTTVTASGGVSVYYNPASYSSPTSYSAYQGAGTTITAYMLVNNVNQLQSINDSTASRSGTYALGRDIDASVTLGWNGGAGFNPIGYGGNQFKGVFDGLGHTISDLYINRPTTDYVGLFGYAETSRISNVGLLNANVTGRNQVGALVGENYGNAGLSSVTGSWATGLVTGIGGEHTGGLVGRNRAILGGQALISDSWADVTVTGRERVGGLAGTNAAENGSTASISGSHASGDVTASSNRAGGLVGWNYSQHGGSTAVITNSYATGGVRSSGANANQYGGLVGFQEGTEFGSALITQSWASGSVINATGDGIGGLIGQILSNQSGSAQVTQSYATGSVTGRNRVGGLVGRNEADNGGDASVSSSHASGTVVGNDQVGGLIGMSSAYTSGSNADVTQSYATGSASGHGMVGGLIGRLEAGNSGVAAVADAYATGSATSTENHAGGAIGQVDVSGATANIDRIHATGAVSGYTYVGGLIGGMSVNNTGSVARVRQSYAEGAVSGRANVGGLIGQASLSAASGTLLISQTYATGDVTATENTAGGLVANAQTGGSNATMTIEKSYATGAVKGLNFIGGLIGYQTTSTGINAKTDVTQSWASGKVTGTGGALGGLVGTLAGEATVATSFWDVTTTGQTQGLGNQSSYSGITGLQSSNAGGSGYAYAQSSYTGWDFANDWYMVDGQTRPFGRWEYSTTITNAHQLQLMALDLSASYTLANDIGLAAAIGQSGGMWTAQGFSPIGTLTSRFTGSFDGGGNVIDGLTIDRADTERVGLFGLAQNASLTNVTLTNVDVVGKDRVGGLVGEAATDGSGIMIIANVGVSGEVGGNNRVGGVVGQLEAASLGGSATISQSFSDTDVSGARDVGGLIGYASASHGSSVVIDQTYAEGSVTASSDGAGGIAGSLNAHGSGTVQLERSYSLAAVTGQNYLGGLVGYHYSDDINGGLASIDQSFASGRVTGTGSHLGGLVGYNPGGSTIANSYWDTDTTGQATAIGNTASYAGATAVQSTNAAGANYAFDQSTYVGWDFANDWYMVDGDTRAFGRWENSTTITNAHQLQLMALDLDADYRMASDIDLGAALSANGGMWAASGFSPVGTDGAGFTGSLDGGGHVIDGLMIDRASQDHVGLFGYVQNAAIRNLSLTNADVTGGQHVGALAGSAVSDDGLLLIENVSATGTVSGDDEVGGLIGALRGGTGGRSLLNGAHTNVAVSGNSRVGGLVGINQAHSFGRSEIRDSSAWGAVAGLTAGLDIGGLVGLNRADGAGAAALIESSYASGAVTAGTSENVGGLVGRNDTTGDDGVASIDQSYATGVVTGQTAVGGLVGRSQADGANSSVVTTNSYATGDVTGTDQVGGFIGHLEASGFGSEGVVDQSHATGDVNGSAGYQRTGGLIGYAVASNNDSSILVDRSNAVGHVSGNGRMGGLIGEANAAGLRSTVLVDRSHATGNIGGYWQGGGLIGFAGAHGNDAVLTIDRSHATGSVTGTDTLGGLIGWFESNAVSSRAVLSNSHATGAVSGTTWLGGLVGYTYGGGGELLVTQSHATGAVTGTGNQIGGLIGRNIAAYAGKLTVSESHATGSVNGANLVGGLIGYTDASGVGTEALVSQSYATGAVSGGDQIGGLIGQNRAAGGASSVIEDSRATGAVSGNEKLGGLVGENYAIDAGSHVRIDRSYATGSTSGAALVGGLVGHNFADLGALAEVDRSYATGAVDGSGNFVGGLIGVNFSQNASTATVHRSYALGTVSGLSDVGGLVGQNYALGAGSTSSISQSYAIGLVDGTTNVGGLVGFHYGDTGGNATITASFWNPASTGQAEAVGNVADHTGAAALQTTDASGANYAYAASTYTDAGWDLGADWGVLSGTSYAYHQWRYGSGPSVISGTVSGVASGNGGLGVTGAINGSVLASTMTGADGSYYMMFDAVADGAALSWLTGATHDGGVTAGRGNALAMTTGGHATGLAIRAGWVSAKTGATTLTSAISGLFTQAKGALNDAGILYGTSGTTLTLNSAGLDLAASGAFAIDSALNYGANKLRIAAAGALTLTSGATITSSAGDDAVVLSGSSFINNRGSDAISVTGGGRWLVYAASPTGNSYGDLNSGNTAVWNTAYTADGTVADSGNRYVFAYRPTLTYTSVDATKTYGDAIDLSASFTVGGLHEGIANVFLADTLGDVISGDAAVTSAGAGATAGAGSYDIDIAQGSLTSTRGYDLAFASDGTLTVGKRAITVTAQDASKVYGDANPAFTATASGLAAHDVGTDLADLLTGFGVDADGIDATTDAGSYADAIEASGTSSNYDITFVDGDLTISKRAITVTAQDASKVYGDANPAFTAIASGLAAHDAGADLADLLTGFGVDAASYGATTNAGSYAGAIKASGSSSNYDVTFADGDLTVTKRAITVSAHDAAKVQGQIDPLLGWSITSGSLASFHSVNDVLAGHVARTAGEAAGTYAINQGTLGLVSTNYSMSFDAGTFTITAAAPAPIPVAPPTPYIEKPVAPFAAPAETSVNIVIKSSEGEDEATDEESDVTLTCASGMLGSTCAREPRPANLMSRIGEHAFIREHSDFGFTRLGVEEMVAHKAGGAITLVRP